MKQSSRKRVLMAAICITLAVGGVRAAFAHPAIAKPVCRFMHFYQATETAAKPMSAWERVLVSLMLTQGDNGQSKI